MKTPLRLVALLVICLLPACGGAPAPVARPTVAPGQAVGADAPTAVAGLSNLVPADVTLFGELRHVDETVSAWLPEQDGLALAGEYLARELGVSPRALTQLLRSLEGLGVALREVEGETQIAVLLTASRSGPLEQLLADAPLQPSGRVAGGGERYLLSDEAQEQLEIEREDAPTTTLFAERGLLVVGAKELADDIGEVQAGGAPALSSSRAFLAASDSFVSDGVNAYLDVASLVPEADPKARSLLDAVLAQRTPMVATMTAGPEQRLTIHAGLSGTAMPDSRLYAAPPPLDLARRLPRETVAYQAYSSRFGLRGDELARALQSFVTRLNPSAPAMVRQLESELGLSLSALLDGLGAQGVVGVVAPWTLRPGDKPVEQLAFVWIQQLRAGAQGKALFRSAVAKLETAARRDGLKLTARRDGNHLIVAAGDAALVERSLEAFAHNKATLRGNESHERSSGTVQGSQLLMWVDTQRIASMLGEAFPDAGRALAVLHREGGPDNISGAVALGWRLERELWRLRLDMIDASTVGMLAALSIYGVRRYLASSKTSEAKNIVGAIARGAAAAYEREQLGGGHALCKSASPVPARIPTGTKYMPRQTADDDWNSGDEQTGWRCLRLALTLPHYYRYRYVAGGGYIGPQHGLPDPGPNGFEAIAEGDLDGDGVTSLFVRQGKVDPRTGRLTISPQLLVVQEFE